MANKRVGYTLEKKKPVKIMLDLYEKYDPQGRLVELAIAGKTGTDEYKKIVEECSKLETTTSDDIAHRMWKRLTSSPVVLELANSAKVKCCPMRMELSDALHRSIARKIVARKLAEKLIGIDFEKLETALAECRVGFAQEIKDAPGFYRLTFGIPEEPVELTDDRESFDDNLAKDAIC